MSFFNAIKRSFGFGNDADDGLLEDSAEAPALQLPEPETPKCDDNDRQVEIDRIAVDRIFDHVIATFNEALPDFIAKAIDPEVQRKKLYDGLDASLKDYLDTLSSQTRSQCEIRWAAEQSSMRSEMDSLKAKAKEIEQQRFDIKQQQLSADRQRRALNDRVHDLENQLTAFQAEREQLDLENKSLVNKLKVASVHESEAETLRQELNDARAEIIAIRNAAQSGEPIVDNAAAEKMEALESEIASLSEQLDAAAEKDRIATEMLNGLQSKASAATSKLAERDEEIARLKAEIDEARRLQDDIEQLTGQMNRIEEVIEKRDRKIAKLKETCENLRNENASLQRTIAANLKAQAESEDKLKRRIAELESDPTTPIVSDDMADYNSTDNEQAIADTPKISDGDLAAIEESFDSADWMRSDPPVTPSMRAGISEAEFGYQPPTRKNTRHDNDAQLSLF